MAECEICQTASAFISEALGVCTICIRERPREALEITNRAHRESRVEFGLPPIPPHDPEGVRCNLCVNACRIGENDIGYCGLRENRAGQLTGRSAARARLSWYHDPLPTNCVADWVCAGGTGAGYPTYSHCPGAELRHKNLAVFFQACSFNCLYCQNWHFKRNSTSSSYRTVEDLLKDVDLQTSCICYFGGDPSPQLPFSIKASRAARDKKRDDILRICWETNGSMNPKLLDRVMELAVDSGGCVKFDLKAWDNHLHLALTGVENQRTLENFARAAKQVGRRDDPPILLANTLMVPGYIDVEEISAIARFIASLDPDIPYSLLAFHPQFYMSDLPLTPKHVAERCLESAREAGLSNVIKGGRSCRECLTYQLIYEI